MKIGHIIALVLVALGVAAWYKWETIKKWFSVEVKKSDNAAPVKSDDDDTDENDDSVDCSRQDVTKWTYIFDVTTLKTKLSQSKTKTLTDIETVQTVKDIYNHAKAYFNAQMTWHGTKKGKISFSITSKGAKSIINSGIAAANIPYRLKCFVE